jgi:hypothetical protein
VVVRVLNLGDVAISRMPAAEGPLGNNAHAGSARSLRAMGSAPKGAQVAHKISHGSAETGPIEWHSIFEVHRAALFEANCTATGRGTS